jgi:membrane protease YdiL (CAAX protease family)
VADARRTYARVGFALAGMYVAVHGGQRLLSLWVPPLVATYLPIYGLGLPVFLMLVGKGGTRPASRPLKVLEALALLPTCLFVAYVGNILGYGLQWVLDALITVDLLPEVAGPGVGFLGLQMALVTVASPVMEEVVFRRCLIDRLQVHGQRTALVVSALAFGLFHGTANQLCYGALIGLVLDRNTVVSHNIKDTTKKDLTSWDDFKEYYIGHFGNNYNLEDLRTYYEPINEYQGANVLGLQNPKYKTLPQHEYVEIITKAQLTQQATFEGWDFQNIWKMGTNGPTLR